MNLLEKFRTGALALMHVGADRLLAINSVETARQIIRDLEADMREVEGEANEASGMVRTLKRQIVDKRADADHLQEVIDEILTNDDLADDPTATPKQVKLTGVKKALAGLGKDLEDAEKVSVQAEEALQTLESLHEQAMAKLDDLDRVERRKSVKQTAAKAIERTHAALNSGVDKTVDGFIARAVREADTADVAYERATAKLGEVTGQNEAIADARREIAKRKAELGMKAKQPVGATAG